MMRDLGIIRISDSNDVELEVESLWFLQATDANFGIQRLEKLKF